VQPGVTSRVQPFGLRNGEVAVGDQRPETREAELATMSVTGEDQVEAVACHGVNDAQVRRMGDADAQDAARQMRFLASRGFGGDVIRQVVKGDSDD